MNMHSTKMGNTLHTIVNTCNYVYKEFAHISSISDQLTF